jgi:outer membrane protein TolC
MLKASRALAALLLVTAVRLSADEPGPPRLSLAAAVSEALRQNDRILDAHDSVEQADLQVRLARNAFRPHLVPNLQGAFGQSDLANQTYRLDLTQKLPFGTQVQSTVGASSRQNQIGTYYASDTTLQLSQPLLRGRGRAATRRELSSAEERRLEAARQSEISAQRLVVDVAASYYRTVSQGRLAGVAEKSLERARRLRDASQAKLEIGKVSQLDVARAQQLVAQAEGQLLDARAAVEDAKDSLRLLLGRGNDANFVVDDEIPRNVEPVSEEAAESLALTHRRELAGTRASAEAAERAVAFAKNQLLPQFDLSLALTRQEVGDTFSASIGLDHFRTAAFFNVSLPVDRKPAQIEYNNALIERDRRRRQARTLERQIVGEARRAARQQDRLLRSLEVADAAVEYARTEVEVAQMRYESGLSNNLDVVTAEAGFLAAEGRRIETLAALAVARLDLRATLGTLDPKVDAGSEP